MNRMQLKAKRERRVWRDNRKAVQREEDRHFHTYGAAMERQAERERRMENAK